MATDDIKELGTFILDKFRHPNYDLRYLGASSDYMQLERDIMRTLNDLSKTAAKTRKSKLFDELRGHVLGLGAVQYYNPKEMDEILEKIDKAEAAI